MWHALEDQSWSAAQHIPAQNFKRNHKKPTAVTKNMRRKKIHSCESLKGSKVREDKT